jgi:kynurenine 3-monooxygenase
MALDNFVEMRDTSADPRFALKRQLEHRLEEQYPGRFFSKYSMVSFQRFPYVEALERGKAFRMQILIDACTGKAAISEIDVAATFNKLQTR